jgi:hypothetical protein
VLFNQKAAGAMGARAALAGAGAAACVALIWLIVHALILRGDGRWLAADRAGTAEDEGVDAATVVAAVPRSYRREDLAALAAGAGIQVLPARPIVVVDGADGTVGAAALVALRRALPDTVLWPIGLNAAAQIALLNALGDVTPPIVPGDALNRAAVILGTSDILLPGGLDGEVDSSLAAALAESPARILLLPPREARLRWVAAPAWPRERWIENAVIEITNFIKTA